jgi:hypothetical protein
MTIQYLKLNSGSIKLFARSLETGEVTEIEDLYWFEEQGVHDFDGQGHFESFEIELVISEAIAPLKPEL